VAQILALEKSILLYEEKIALSEKLLLDEPTEQEVITLQADLDGFQEKLEVLKTTVTLKKSSMGIDNALNLNRLKNDEFLRLRANARATKISLRQKLVARKFEIGRLERSYRVTSSGMFCIYLVIVNNV
jgi:hypothetical protein